MRKRTVPQPEPRQADPASVVQRRSRWIDAAIAAGMIAWLLFVTDRRPTSAGAWEAPRASAAWRAAGLEPAAGLGTAPSEPDSLGDTEDVRAHDGVPYTGVLIGVDVSAGGF
ncbi:MAG: hypothetical protein AAF288_03230 [Planctomycetota bacterium]